MQRDTQDGQAHAHHHADAREEERDKVYGLELGADDYITKPFSVRELLARVKTNVRRRSVLAEPAEAGDEPVRAGRLTIDASRQTVAKDGVELDLTQREFELIRFMSRPCGKVFSREELMREVWQYEYYGDVRAVDVAIRRLREKIEDAPPLPQY